jgi:response regulator of citrate/malate metabolism
VNPSKTADTLGYLSKPIDLQKLDEALAVYADRRRSDLT